MKVYLVTLSCGGQEKQIAFRTPEAVTAYQRKVRSDYKKFGDPWIVSIVGFVYPLTFEEDKQND